MPRPSLAELLLLATALTGCYGRIDDTDARARRLPTDDLALQDGKPTILVFGAGWCKPCRHEISAFNALATRYAAQLTVIGLLVEGTNKGDAPDAEALAAFTDTAGQRPAYTLLADPDWRRMTDLSPPEGRQLPLIVFADADGMIQDITQRSLDLDSELVPRAEALIANAPLTPPPTPDEPEPAAARGQMVDVAAWTETLPQGAHNPLYLTIEDGWRHGLGAFGFVPSEMPFTRGKLRIRADDSGEWVDQGLWTSTSGCSLTVSYDRAGKYVSATGVCQ